MAQRLPWPMSRFTGSGIALAILSFPLIPASAEDAEFAHHPDIAISLFAAEPLVVDPVALAFSSNGDLFVVEMRDYPYGLPPDGKPGGTIRLLRDTDGDGQADYAVVFARDLSYPTSVTPWRRGILVAAPPQILYLEDSDGDDVADVREVIAEGFQRGVTDGNLSGLQWGLDNRIHGTKGASSATVKSPLNDDPPLRLGGYDFALDPDTGKCTRTSESSAGFGLVFDAFGHAFSDYNVDYLQQHIVPSRYLENCAGLPRFETTVNISEHGKSARIFPVSAATTRLNHPEQSGHFSAASGMAILDSPLFPPTLGESILVADVVGNLVHRNRLREEGAIFRGARVVEEKTSEFLASRESEFRPVSMAFGPDGALYLTDMRRSVIEHPDYIPPKVRATLDLRAGENRGRIYRIKPSDRDLPLRADLAGLAPREIATYLGSANPWSAETAQRLLFEDQARSVGDAIRAATLKSKRPETRARGLWSLQGLGILNDPEILAALQDEAPGVRENALILAGARPAMASAIIPLLSDPHPRIRFQAALSASLLPPDAALAAPLWALLSRDPADHWTRRAVLVAAKSHTPELLRRLIEAKADAAAVTDFAHALTAQPADTVVVFLESLPPESISAPLLDGLDRGWEINTPDEATLARLVAHVGRWANAARPETVAPLLDLTQRFGIPVTGALEQHVLAAYQNAANSELPLDARLEAIATIGKVALQDSREPLTSLLAAAEPAAVHLATLAALQASKNLRLGPLIVENWRALSPVARPEAIRILLSTSKLQTALLDGLESQSLTLAELNLDLEQRRTLLRWSSPFVRLRAAKFLTDEEYQGRKATVGEWLIKLPPVGDPTEGKAAFEIHCSTCHQLDGTGHPVGPNLASLAHRSTEDILTHILDPNMAINARYATCTVEKITGESVTGILQTEDTDALTLLLPLGQQQIILRPLIKSFRALSTSLMPEGLEAAFTPQSMRDLIAYLQEPRAAPMDLRD
jgi:putative membrane-bound dehydrogenase-like protein